MTNFQQELRKMMCKYFFYISGRAPMLPFALEEMLLRFQHHKPQYKPLSYLPPTRAKEYEKVNTSTKHTKSLNVYFKI